MVCVAVLGMLFEWFCSFRLGFDLLICLFACRFTFGVYVFALTCCGLCLDLVLLVACVFGLVFWLV